MATRVLMVFDLPYAVKPGYDFTEEFADPEGSYTENDVYQALLECGYEVHRVSLFDDVRPLLDAVRDIKPEVIFNLCDTFDNVTHWDKNILATMELLGVPCTGATSSALFLCNDKALSKKILRFHRVRTPRFHTFYPAAIKSGFLKTLEVALHHQAGDRGSLARYFAGLDRRRRNNLPCPRQDDPRTHESGCRSPRKYIDGRELYVSIIGDSALRVLPCA